MSWAFSALLSHTQHTHTIFHSIEDMLWAISAYAQTSKSCMSSLLSSSSFHPFDNSSLLDSRSSIGLLHRPIFKKADPINENSELYRVSGAKLQRIYLYHCRTAEIKVHVCSVNINCCIKYLTCSCFWATSLFRGSFLSCRAFALHSSTWKR